MSGQKLKIYVNGVCIAETTDGALPIKEKQSKGWLVSSFVNWLRFGGKRSDWIDIDDLEDKIFDHEVA